MTVILPFGDKNIKFEDFIFFVLWSSGNKSALVQKPLRTVFALQGSVTRLLAAVTGSETGWKQKLSSQTSKISKQNTIPNFWVRNGKDLWNRRVEECFLLPKLLFLDVTRVKTLSSLVANSFETNKTVEIFKFEHLPKSIFLSPNGSLLMQI